MGGFGSGRRGDDDAKRITTWCPQLDVRQLQRDDLLLPGRSFLCKLTRFGWTVASIQIEVTESRIILSYDYLKTGEEPRSERYEVPVPVEWTPCNYGGQRAWFRCPGSGCGRRVAILYGRGPFACRDCHGLAYYSQRCSDHIRALARAQAIRERLGTSANMYEPFPDKPRRMHWRTYARLFREHETANAASYPGWIVRRTQKRFARA
jgi:hypothetical protein